jgi:pimeloyl-ACP methyl ester carboxylesterase
MFKLETGQYQYKDMNCSYYICNSGKKETLLFLHPAFADHQIFQYQVEYFSEIYNLITVDMIGHGDSQVNRENVNMGDMPEILSGILKENGIEKVHVIGVSLGSLVAQGFAEKYPDFVTSVTIVGGYSIHKANEDIVKAQRKEMFKWLFKLIFSMPKFKEYVVQTSVHTEKGKELFRKGISKFSRKSFRGMQGMNRIFTKKAEPVNYPLLIICGEHDIDLAKRAGKRLEEIEPSSKFVLVKRAGHCVNVDAPENFNQLLEGFLKQNG